MVSNKLATTVGFMAGLLGFGDNLCLESWGHYGGGRERNSSRGIV